ncbi:MAG TPA: serine O-acetyltransferase [Thermoanaerobaculia bacterium]|nr:serine O-acetyltransferase [Thermoanaerobaculia bacterium]
MSGPGEARAEAAVAAVTPGAQGEASPAPPTTPRGAPRQARRGNLAADARRLRELKSKPFPWYVIESLLFENGYQAVVLHRVAHACKRRHIPVLGPLFARLSLFLTGVDIAPAAEIGPGLLISHGVGIVIGGYARIGAGATILHAVTIGGPYPSRRREMPTVGDDVFIGAGAMIIGDIHVGDRCFIGAAAMVNEDIPDDSVVVAETSIEIKPRRVPEA